MKSPQSKKILFSNPNLPYHFKLKIKMLFGLKIYEYKKVS